MRERERERGGKEIEGGENEHIIGGNVPVHTCAHRRRRQHPSSAGHPLCKYAYANRRYLQESVQLREYQGSQPEAPKKEGENKHSHMVTNQLSDNSNSVNALSRYKTRH